MAKFVIECPKCGKSVQASSGLFGTGLFAARTVKCACGEKIEVKPNKLASRVCPHCGNNVVFDRSKGEKAKCPVCGTPVNTLSQQSKLEEFSCEQCNILLSVKKGSTDEYICPVCGHANNVEERIQKEKIRKSGMPFVIKYEGDNSTFVWKHPIEDFACGSQLIVHESQEAVFFRDGQALDLFGPGRYTLETQNLPLLNKVYKLPTSNTGTFHSEVYYINKTVQMGIKWGTPDKVRFLDPITGMPLEIGASGQMNLMAADSRKLLLKLVGTTAGIAWGEEGAPASIACEKCGEIIYTSTAAGDTAVCPGCGHVNAVKTRSGFTRSLQAAFRPMIVNAVKSNLAAAIRQNEIDILEVDEKLPLLSAVLREKVEDGFAEYGLTVPQLYVTHIVLPEDDPNFRRFRELHTVELQKRTYRAESDIETARREAELARQQTETEIAMQRARRRMIDAEVQAESTRKQGLAEADVMAAKGYTQKDVLATQAQVALAEGIGNMGPDTVTGGGGGSMMGDIMGLGVGMAAMGSIAPQLGNILGGMNAQASQPPANPPAAPAADGGWNCPACGTQAITTPFCPHCGGKKPEPAEKWDCPKCGSKGITTNFCPQCGAAKPAPEQGWTCPGCGAEHITTPFCPHCGAKKPEEARGWTCPGCGNADITSNFCPKCGQKKPQDSGLWNCPNCGTSGIDGNFCPTCGNKRQ